MINDLLDGISTALYNRFGADYGIHYSTDIYQAVSPPCFNINVISNTYSRKNRNRYLQECTIDIIYIPKKKGSRAEMLNVAEMLLTTVNEITLLNGDVVFMFNTENEIAEGALHYTVNFSFYIAADAPRAPFMEELSYYEQTR